MAKKTLWPITTLIVAGVIAIGCGGDSGNGPPDDDPFNKIQLDLFKGITPAGDNAVYELWASGPDTGLTAAGEDWVSLGRFDVTVNGSTRTMVDEQGTAISQNTFVGLNVDLADYDELFVTVEPSPDSDTLPSASVYLSGTIDLPGSRFVPLEFPASDLGDLDNNARFTFATPTDSDTTNELSGVWFMLAQGQLSLFGLPSAPEGWIYEGWVTVDGFELSTGRFSGPSGADMDARYYSGGIEPPAFPGEDFLVNSPFGGLSFPFVFGPNDEVKITVEPFPDMDPSTPFGYSIYVIEPGQTPTGFQNFKLDPQGRSNDRFPKAQGLISLESAD